MVGIDMCNQNKRTMTQNKNLHHNRSRSTAAGETDHIDADGRSTTDVDEKNFNAAFD